MEKKIIIILLFLCIGFVHVYASTADTSLPATKSNTPAEKKGPQPFNNIITSKAKTSVGLFIVYQLDDKTYFEVPDSIIGREILIVNRISKAGANMRSKDRMTGYAGDLINSTDVRFEKGPNDRLFMRKVSNIDFSLDSTSSMYKTILNSNIQPIALTFDIKAYHQDSVTHK
ncbi:protein of unknown function [Chitinophaga costaii]|uniref:DUF5118 domain-containing protein n=1 Tax=Chitinophaga costaii TaxID=1335309 RepID=A0A1C4EGU4_9BACT|nr:DUF5118 domain-containing protein [Chitinophaga costaii]PUZ23834.1 DUF5118 domain-containing protein [Chitinophaga costaii]SCC42794.1 protein of unknown function [Chitinophaga costaii]